MPKMVGAFIGGIAALFVIFAAVALFRAAVPALTAPTLAEKDISLQQAMDIARGAIEECKKANSNISVAVVDRVGAIRFAVRATGASPEDLDIARRKAYTARTFRNPTSAWIERTKPGEDPVSLVGQRQLADTITKAGGVPIMLHGDAIGGVGVTGSKAGDTADEACAQAGLKMVEGNLG